MPAGLSRRDQLIDWVVVMTLLGSGLLAIFIFRDLDLADHEPRIPVWGEYALTVALMVPLAWRRRYPLTVLAMVGVLFIAYRIADVPEGAVSSIALFLALFTAGAQSPHPARDWIRGGIVLATMILLAWQLLVGQEFVGVDLFVFITFNVLLNGAFFVAAWLLGDSWRARRRNERELEQRNVELAAEREARARRAVLDERVRIARELHDVVAHHVSVMGVQAAGARRMLDHDPARAADALAAVERSGRDAVGELQRLVGFLREVGVSDDAQPQPTLADLDRLVASAGLPVRLRWIGTARQVPSSVELSAYRIVQESLTNVLKHAGNVPTTVVVTYTTDALQVEVHNERGAPAPAGNGAGRGLLGMRERVAMLGGRFEHGVADGGYRVLATLPTDDAYDREPARDGGGA